ncbi:transcriptional regulator [Rhodanobacter sp. DHB23]|uniref:transcriptional regulator n=1 Tax=Rhodanobacter sp. DHB23 TaxID=2775923 RepID=UPI00177F6D1C|nr:transcriptional regulator [Rhodanobacter sp. DHB23]MBD8874035.1 transcriptional regulator [Rhodanobacter sp. DHB23]
MNAPSRIGAVMALDRLVHEPARLLILAVLVNAREVEFGFLEQVSGLSKGNLSSHVGKLEAGGLVEVKKSFRGKRPLTELRITAAGRKALADYRQSLAMVVQELPAPGVAAKRK